MAPAELPPCGLMKHHPPGSTKLPATQAICGMAAGKELLHIHKACPQHACEKDRPVHHCCHLSMGGGGCSKLHHSHTFPVSRTLSPSMHTPITHDQSISRSSSGQRRQQLGLFGIGDPIWSSLGALLSEDALIHACYPEPQGARC